MQQLVEELRIAIARGNSECRFPQCWIDRRWISQILLCQLSRLGQDRWILPVEAEDAKKMGAHFPCIRCVFGGWWPQLRIARIKCVPNPGGKSILFLRGRGYADI